jgi:Kef-type K+ transport system membrane component KefB
MHLGLHYPLLQAFTAGSSLSSTSFGTTLIALRQASKTPTPMESLGSQLFTTKMEMTRTRVGTVLTTASMLDDIMSLCILGILSAMAEVDVEPSATAKVSILSYDTVGAPIVASIALASISLFLSHFVFRPYICSRYKWGGTPVEENAAFIGMLLVLIGMVTVADAIGTSRLLGAFMAGLILKLSFADPSASSQSGRPGVPFGDIYVLHIKSIAQHLLLPLFFTSMGIGTLFFYVLYFAARLIIFNTLRLPLRV